MIQLFVFMLTIGGQLLGYSGPIRGTTAPPKGVAVKVAEYITVDGKRVGIQEWSDKK